MSTVTIVIRGVIVLHDFIVLQVSREVPAVVIIHKAIVIIICSIVRNLSRIDPDVGGKIHMIQVYTRVYYSHYGRSRLIVSFECLGGVYICIKGAVFDHLRVVVIARYSVDP